MDEQAAKIVQMIFRMKLDGYNPGKIAERLDEMGVLTPQQYKRSMGLNSNAGAWRCENPHWCAAMVRRVLTNETYTGCLVQGKNKKINYKVKQSLPVDESKWIRTPGTHEAIITKEAFERVQHMLKSDTRTPPNKDRVNIFSGMVKCAGCGQNMTRRVISTGGKKYNYYMCSTSKAGKGCKPHRINEKKLERAVLAIVQKQIEMLLDKGVFEESLKEIPQATYRIRVLNDQIVALDKEIIKYQELKENLYEDFREGIIDDTDYEELKKRFTQKIHNARKALLTVKEKKTTILEKPAVPPEWTQEVKELGRVSSLTRKTVIMLIDQIIVYDKERIEVKFHYGDELKAFLMQEDAPDIMKKGGMTL